MGKVTVGVKKDYGSEQVTHPTQRWNSKPAIMSHEGFIINMPGNLRYGGVSQKPPSRTMSLDSLHDRKAVSLDNKVQQYLTTRVSKTTPKANEAAMQFVKVGPAGLYKNAMVQLKTAEAVKEMRKEMEEEVVDWREPYSSSPNSSNKNPYDEGSDWQSNLDKWKSSRRKRNEEALGRVIEIKKNEQEEELCKTRRKSKTFSEIQGDKSKRGRRYNLVVHDDDNNDLTGLGLSGGANKSPDDIIDQDNKDAKSDAGFCTGSDTGSDGVFAEDNISDTSSALGDKKEAHDSLLDTGMSKEEELHINGHASTSLTSSTLITEDFTSSSTSTTTTRSRTTTSSNHHTDEYTYDKAIAGYKQYAENSAKKRTSSITSLNSNTSYTKEDEKKIEKFGVANRSPSPNKSKKLEGMVNFFSKEMEKEAKTSPEPKVTMREKSPKVDIGKRRSMFESHDPASEFEQKQTNRRSLDMSSGSLKNRVASFENLDSDGTSSRVRTTTPTRDANLKMKVASFERLDTETTTKYRGITPPKDTNFHEKLATFATSESESQQQVRKKTPDRDVNFHKKLASFTNLKEDRESVERSKTLPQGDPTLRSKIASFNKMEREAETHSTSVYKQEMMQKNERMEETTTMLYKDRSVSLENLDEPLSERKLRPSQSMGNILRRTPSTPYMVVDLQEAEEAEQQCEVETRPAVNAQVFEIASKLQETPLLGSPIHKSPSLPLPTTAEAAATCDEDSLDATNPYTDDDINEVIKEYEVVNEEYADHPDNIYENITDEPVYENIYEKVGGDEEQRGDTIENHHYQTLEEVREEAGDHQHHAKPFSQPPPPSPPPPHQSSSKSPFPTVSSKESPPPFKKLSSSVLSASPPKVSQSSSPFLPPAEPPTIPEVLDVTWTDSGLSSLAAPPSEPPPPPPPDDDDDFDSCDLQSLPKEQQHGDEEGFTRENSTRRLKKELNRRRSDFLGTSSHYIEEEPMVKPPPDLMDLLRQEREVDRTLRSPTQQVLMEEEIARREREIIENLERSEQMKQQEQHTMGETIVTDEDKSEMEEHLQYQESPVLDARLSTNPPHSNSHSVSEFQDLLHDFGHDTVDASYTPQKSFDNREIITEKYTTSENVIRYNRVNTTYDVLQGSVNAEQRYSQGLETHAFDVAQSSVGRTTQVEAEWESNESNPRDYDHTLVADPSQANMDGSMAHEYQKLAELEEEMMRHDKDMLRRVGHLPAAKSDPPPSTHQHLPIQEFYTAPAYESTPPPSLNEAGFKMEDEGIVGYRTVEDQMTDSIPSPSQYTSPHPHNTSHHPFARSNSQSTMETSSSPAPPHAPLQAARSSPASGPEPLPRRRKVPPPAPNKTTDLNTAERREAMRVSRMTSNEPQRSEHQIESVEQTATSGHQMTKQTLLALSAIPKPKLTDNESWITKKKAETQKRDISKHWLLQEAEQRRLEQQDRISRQKYTSAAPPPQPSSPQTIPSPSLHHPSTKLSSSPLQNNPIYPPQATTPVYSSYPQALKTPSPVHSNSSSIVNSSSSNNNNSWRNQATTYQPHIPTPAPTSDKALPDSIIHNLTQRVNNKNKNAYNNSGGRLSSNSNSSSSYSNHRDDNYHDYMNADALSNTTASPPGHSPLYQGPGQPSPPIPQPQDPSSSPQQDQRLLSVSGKKKCSHCSEELGRGAAMIIESLRLFYHIPCFKCCVCGIQLGNGSAGADVRVRNHKLHCHNCYSNDEGELS
ncbi:hypothetical protein Pmani_010194 [Petrolisthes manimaculis]|uniref:LIM zinc-binding domain-containing protein n=2 Tax=Petrolisthes manimaculis TaxID=1843537 RepID=A0AAE1UC73_9EUCA|nr:hypothetical protein Pmani_010194 [Petrolisthes manimaculis]